MKNKFRQAIILITLVLLFLTSCTDANSSFSRSSAEIAIDHTEEHAESLIQEDSQHLQSEKKPAPEEEVAIPSLWVTIEGEPVLLIDMDDPVVRSIYTGCDGYDVSKLEISISYYDDLPGPAKNVTGFLDSRYTYPLYQWKYGNKTEGWEQMAEDILNGGSLLDYIMQDSYEQYTGIVFDESGFPIAEARWTTNDDRITSWSRHVKDDMNRYQQERRPYAFRFFFETFCNAFVMTEDIKEKLTNSGFDYENTKVIAGGFYTAQSYLFYDGTHELLLINGDVIDPVWYGGMYVTPQEFVEEIATGGK